MRIFLDRLYLASGVLAALFMVTIAGVVLAQIVGRFLGFLVPSATEIAGFCVAATTFLALAPTLQRGGHIRVALVLEHLPERVHRWVEAWCLTVGLGMTVYFARWVIDLVLGSIRFHDVSPGLLAVPLWIPQLGMAVGLVIFAICLLDNLISLLRTGGEPAYRAFERAGSAEDVL